MHRSARLVLACAAASVVALLAPGRAGAFGWLPLTPAPNATGGAIADPAVAVDYNGNAYAAWIEGGVLKVSLRPVGGEFEPPQTLDPGVTSSAKPDIDVDDRDDVLVVWRETVNAGTNTIRQATRPHGYSAFGPPVDVDTGPASAKDDPKLAVDSGGTAVLAIRTHSGGVGVIRAFLGTAVEGFTHPYTEYSEGPNSQVFAPDVAISEASDAVVAWRAFSSGSTRMRSAFFRCCAASFDSTAEAIVPPDSIAKHDPSVAIDFEGNAVAVWDEDSTTQGSIRAYARPASPLAGWSKVSDLDPPQQGNALPHVAFDFERNAVAVWAFEGGLRDAMRPPGGTFAVPPESGTGTSEQPSDLALDEGPTGTIALTWTRGGGASPVVRAAVRPDDRWFGDATLSPDGHGGTDADVAAAGLGNAAAVWVDTNPPGASPRLVEAAYDATGPYITELNVPTSAWVGQRVEFSASAHDDWSVPTFVWDFGDGEAVAGRSVSHIYARPGVYRVTASASDAAANVTSATTSVVVTDIPTRGVDFEASKLSGKVFVSVPTSAPAGRVLARPPKGYRRFRLLREEENIPIGSILDATKGTTRIKTARNRIGTLTQIGRFSGGVFKTKQSKGSALTTAVMMGGGDFSSCRRGGLIGFLGAPRERPHRRLFGNVKGRFRMRGRNSSSTVLGSATRGAEYIVKDSCSGTLTIVRKRSVVVEDLVKHRRRIVRAGHRYLARPRR